MKSMKEQLLQGIPFPLNDTHELSLIAESDIDDLVDMLNDDEVTEFLWFAPAPEQFYRDYFTPMAEQNAQARQGKSETSNDAYHA